MCNFEYKHYGNDLVIFNKDLFEDFSLNLFNPQYLNSNTFVGCNLLKSIDGQERGSVHVFNYHGNVLALRHYFRGGLISKIINDKYLWQGIKRTRAVCELHMLSNMQKMGLPVPTPVAVHIHKVGLFYSTDIITQFISNSRSISSVLANKVIPVSTWHDIGSAIKKFHDRNCNHVDLNAHNILIDEENRVYLIDFDRSKIEKNTGTWKKKNIKRLKRSFEKLKKTRETFNYMEKDFNCLLEGYDGN